MDHLIDGLLFFLAAVLLLTGIDLIRHALKRLKRRWLE